MKKLLTALLLLTATLLPAQDFKLYFANNVTDVLDFNSIESTESGLQWREVKDKELAGNIVEVDAVKQMFASADVKYRAQQRQFWRMRDHNLLCFRIDDGTAGANSYQVEVEDTVGRPKAITVNRYFFLNVMRQDAPISLKVWATGNPENAIHFKYYVADWDDDNLYTFQLDSRRQLADEVYSLEYRYSYVDDTGTYQVESQQLALRDSAFQSFYIADNQNLIDVFLKSGDHKLRLDKTRLHTGVTLDPDFERTVLSTRFILDKHENRELVNFNWIGSGLYEQYDTLYLSLHNEQGANITKATMHVDAVDMNGNSTGATDVRYLGYNRQKKAHLILTHGNPAYIEILATGYCPALYRYAGAADSEGIVDLERCTDNITLFANPADEATIAISSQHEGTTQRIDIRIRGIKLDATAQLRKVVLRLVKQLRSLLGTYLRHFVQLNDHITLRLLVVRIGGRRNLQSFLLSIRFKHTRLVSSDVAIALQLRLRYLAHLHLSIQRVWEALATKVPHSTFLIRQRHHLYI